MKSWLDHRRKYRRVLCRNAFDADISCDTKFDIRKIPNTYYRKPIKMSERKYSLHDSAIPNIFFFFLIFPIFDTPRFGKVPPALNSNSIYFGLDLGVLCLYIQSLSSRSFPLFSRYFCPHLPFQFKLLLSF